MKGFDKSIIQPFGSNNYNQAQKLFMSLWFVTYICVGKDIIVFIVLFFLVDELIMLTTMYSKHDRLNDKSKSTVEDREVFFFFSALPFPYKKNCQHHQHIIIISKYKTVLM